MFLSRGDRDLGVAFQTHPGRQAFVSRGSEEPRSALESRRWGGIHGTTFVQPDYIRLGGGTQKSGEEESCPIRRRADFPVQNFLSYLDTPPRCHHAALIHNGFSV